MAETGQDGRLRVVLSTLVRAAAITVAGVCVGLAYNALSAQGIPLQTPSAMTTADYVNWNLHLTGMRVLTDEAKQAFDDRSAVFIDARSRRAYAAGHIPGAIQLQGSEVETRGRELLEDHPRDIRIITYCSGGRCQSSLRLASRLTEELGFTNVGAYYEGWAAWRRAGHPVSDGEEP